MGGVTGMGVALLTVLYQLTMAAGYFHLSCATMGRRI